MKVNCHTMLHNNARKIDPIFTSCRNCWKLCWEPGNKVEENYVGSCHTSNIELFAKI